MSYTEPPPEDNRVIFQALAAIALLGLALAGCASTQKAEVQNKDNLLAAAGFQLRPADTPARIASLKKLPPNKFSVLNKNGQPVFVYPDPTICGCLYYGTMDNYSAYQQLALDQRLASEQEMAAMLNQQAAFDYAPWGPPFY